MSIHDHLARLLPPPGEPLDAAGLRLPDEPELDGTRLNWAPGAQDGVVAYHVMPSQDPDAVARILDLVIRACDAGPGSSAHGELEDAITTQRLVGIADSLSAAIDGRLATGSPSPVALHALARQLALRSARREPVKLGILILGSVRGPDDLPVLTTLGRHDEFTLFAAIAIRRSVEDPDPVLFGLAQGVRGWGRIHLVERLAGATDPSITDWILRAGFRNEVMTGYLALTAATAGRLADRLADDPDEALVDAACELMGALIDEGPVAGISAYPDGPRAVGALLALLAVRPLVTGRLVTTAAIARFLAAEEGPWGSDPGWSAAARAALVERCAEIVGRPGWRELVTAEMRSVDPSTAATARQAARILGMDTFDALLDRVRAEPSGYAWYELMEQTDEARIGAVVELAQSMLPLEAIATGAGVELGLGPEWEPHRALDSVLQRLERSPGHGWPLLRAGLASPVIRNRNLALRAFDAWDRKDWPPDAREVLEAAASAEPDPKVRAKLEGMLADDHP